MVSMNVCVKDARDLPPVLCRQVKIHLWVKRSINHKSLLAPTNEVGETPLSGTPYLDDMCRTFWERHLSDVPGQTPCLHPAIQRTCLYTPCLKVLSCKQAGFASSTHGYHW